MFKHILVPIDGSKTALHAADTAIELAAKINAKITVVHVIHVYPYVGLGDGAIEGLDQYLSAATASASNAISAVQQRVEAAGVAFASRIAESNTVWRGILDAAEHTDTDLIVMGTHGRGMIDRLLLGSVTQRVLSHASVPVMVVRGAG